MVDALQMGAGEKRAGGRSCHHGRQGGVGGQVPQEERSQLSILFERYL